jgi:predicted nucleic acid-binding protein
MSSLILLDTSTWIECFRSCNPLHLEEIVEFDRIVTCLPVIQEVLQGFCDEEAFRIAARRHGVTVRSSVDCLIAACALRHGLTVLHRDRDYSQLAKVSPLQQCNV